MPNSAGASASRGWLPIEMGLDRHPPVAPEGIVRWMEFGDTPLVEPFFSHTVDRLRQVVPPAREWDTDLDAVLRLASRVAPVKPAGFIFHISRCGSTLVANGLRTAEGTVLVSESKAITRLLLPRSEGGAYIEKRWTERRHALLESLFTLFANYRTGTAERLLIKFSSVSTLSLPMVRAYWPDVPCLVIVRDPAEVIVANLPGGGWMDLKNSPERAEEVFGFDGAPVAEMTREEYAARVVGELLRSAMAGPAALCQLVDYEDLNERRIREIAAFFGLQLPEAEKKLEFVLGHYAKDPAARRPFEDDRARKQQQVTPAIRRAAQRWVMPAYIDLRAR